MTVYNTYVRLSSAERYTAGAVHCSDTWHQVVLLRSECHLLQIPSLGEPGCGRVFTVLSRGYHCVVTWLPLYCHVYSLYCHVVTTCVMWGNWEHARYQQTY